MANGPASNSHTLVDELLKIKRDKAKSFGIARQNFSGIGSSIGGAGSKGGDTAKGGSGEAYLKTGGDTMIGPIAFYPKAGIISGGVLDIGLDSSAYSTRVVVTGEGGVDDDLDTIANVAHAGQMLYLQPILTNTITLKHNTGNIFNPQAMDVVVAGGQTVILQWDTVVHANKWVVLTGNGITGAGDNLGDHIATENLKMSTHRIEFGTNIDIFSSGTTLVVGADAGGFISLETGDLPRILISDTYAQLNNSTELRLNANELFFDDDFDTKVQALSDDVLQWTFGGVGGGLKISMSASSTTFLHQIIAGAGIDMNNTQDIINANDITFSAGGGHTIQGSGASGFVFDANDGVGQGSHVFTVNGGLTNVLRLNSITGEITPYMSIIPNGNGTEDLGAGGNAFGSLTLAEHIIFDSTLAQTAGNDLFRIFRDNAGMTWQLGLEGVSDFGRISFRDKDNVERIEFDWNVGNRRANFNYLTEGMSIRQNNSSVDAIQFFPPNNIYSSVDSVINVFKTTMLADEGLQIYRNGQLKVDITSNIAFNNISTFTPNATIAVGGNLVQNTGNITPALDSTYTIGTSATDAYLNVYTDTLTSPAIRSTSDITIQSTADTLIGTAALPSMIQIDATGVIFNSTTVTYNVDINLGTNWIDINGQTGASAGTPAAGVRRLFTDSATGELSVRTSAGTTVSLESGGGASALNDLSDVTLTGPLTAGDYLRYNGSAWVDSPLVAADMPANSIGTAEIAHITDGGLFTWDASAVPFVLAPGTSGQVLTSNGTGAALTWEDSTGDSVLEFNTGSYWTNHTEHSVWIIPSYTSDTYNVAAGTSFTNAAPSFQRHIYPLYISKTVTLKNLSPYVGTAGSGQWKTAIYNNKTNGENYPNTKIAETSNAFLNFTGFGTAAASYNQSLSPGLYWIVAQFHSNNSSNVYKLPAGVMEAIGWVNDPNANGPYVGWIEENTGTAAFPTTFTAIDDIDIIPIQGSSGLMPVIWARF